MSASFLFYDLETFGTDPGRSRIAQFAAIRTDLELQPIGPPIDFLVRPADDLLPSPAAAMTTLLGPQRALREGVGEAEAFARIAEEMGQPGTCSVGYNSLRFDDEFIRYGLYRNFHDPYEREWRNGNSRWDLLDALRLMHALRPDGLTWRRREPEAAGTSFRLEHLAADNGLREGMAHEALSDVRALLGLARRFREAQPRLWDYALSLRDKAYAGRLLEPAAAQPVLHVSSRFRPEHHYAAAVLPLARHPRYEKQQVIVCDLAADPTPLLELPAEAIAARVFTRRADLPDGVERIPLKCVHLNKSPALVPWSLLRGADFARLGLDPAQALRHAERLRERAADVAEKVRQVYAGRGEDAAEVDVDQALYRGFLGEGDRRLLAQVRATPPERLGQVRFPFRDARLPELLLRYRARNWPHTLGADERAHWDAYRRRRLLQDSGLSELDYAGYQAEIARLRAEHAGDPVRLALLDELQAWGEALRAGLG